MDNYLKEFVRIISSISIEDNFEKNMFEKVTENIGTSKNESRKQIAVASIAAVAIAVGVSFFIRSGNIIR